MLKELENDKWLTKNGIHEYLKDNDEYVGEIKDYNIIKDLLNLKENLLNSSLNVNYNQIDEYINRLYLKFKDDITGEILTELKNNGYIS